MKLLFPLFILAFVFPIYGQTRKPTSKSKPKQLIITAPAEDLPTPSHKVVVESKSGDKITGLFVSGRTDKIYIEVSGTTISIPIVEISIIKFTDADESIKSKRPMVTDGGSYKPPKCFADQLNSGKFRIVRAQAGDTVSTVAQRYGHNAAKVAKFNGLLPSLVLKKGREIKLPN